MLSWVSFIILILCFSFNGVSEARHRKHLHPAAIVVGTVYCDTCFRQDSPKSNHFISGAVVAVECGGTGDGAKPSFREEVKTDEKGQFEAKLPFSVSKHAERIEGCSVRLISSSEPYCSLAATAASSEIRRKSKKAGTHVFSAGFFTFKPELCNQKARIKDSVETGFPPSLPDPPAPFLPPVGEGILPPLPVPDLPLPPLVPPLPRLPGIPIPPVTHQKPTPVSDELLNQKKFGFPFPPNPFTPPSLIPPLPFQPSPPSIFPPLPFQPSPPSLFPPIFPSPPPTSLFPPLPFPPVPGLIPSPPPPPPPAFPIPLPPLPPLPSLPPLPPLPPPPGFPKIPPASSSPSGKTSP